jgi:hypothetical protein
VPYRTGTRLANRSGRGNFLLADITGRGQYAGTIMFVDSPSPVWYGEGDDMFFIDGEPWPPRCHGTGTEDYFNTAWCPRSKSIGQHQGVILASHPAGHKFLGKHTFYRFHTADPIPFTKSLLVSLEHGTGNEFVGDWASTSFWYAQGRKKPLAPLPPPAGRVPLPEISAAAGDVLEQAHKSLSYFFQAGEPETGRQLIRDLKNAWEQGAVTAPTARKWVSQLEKKREALRLQYKQIQKKNIVVPHLKSAGKKGVLLEVDRVHGSSTRAPLAGRSWRFQFAAA